jgi:hypothetical protein
MNEQFTYYYRTNNYLIDNYDKKEVLKFNKVLPDFSTIEEQLNLIHRFSMEQNKKGFILYVCVMLEDAERYLSGVVEIGVGHTIKTGFFSKTVKESYFWLDANVYPPDRNDLYDLKINNLDYARQILYDYIVLQKVPDFTGWKHTPIYP